MSVLSMDVNELQENEIDVLCKVHLKLSLLAGLDAGGIQTASLK
jgi:hypothetical protein